jgi:hypothetical protein
MPMCVRVVVVAAASAAAYRGLAARRMTLLAWAAQDLCATPLHARKQEPTWQPQLAAVHATAARMLNQLYPMYNAAYVSVTCAFY